MQREEVALLLSLSIWGIGKLSPLELLVHWYKMDLPWGEQEPGRGGQVSGKVLFPRRRVAV